MTTRIKRLLVSRPLWNKLDCQVNNGLAAFFKRIYNLPSARLQHSIPNHRIISLVPRKNHNDETEYCHYGQDYGQVIDQYSPSAHRFVEFTLGMAEVDFQVSQGGLVNYQRPLKRNFSSYALRTGEYQLIDPCTLDTCKISSVIS